MDGVEDSDEDAERGLQRLLVVHVIGEQTKGAADQGVGTAELPGDLVKAVAQRDLSGAGHQHPERDRLRVAVGELGVGGFGEKHLPPVGRERGQGRAADGHLLGHFLPQESAKAGG